MSTDISYNNVKYTLVAGTGGSTKAFATPNSDFTSNVLNILPSVTIGSSLCTVTDVSGFTNESQLQYITIPYSVTLLDVSAFAGCTNLLDVYMSAGLSVDSVFPDFSGNKPNFHLDGSGSSLSSDLSGYLFDSSNCIVYYSSSIGWPVNGLLNPQISEVPVPATEGSIPVVSFSKLLASGNSSVNASDVLNNNSNNNIIFTNPSTNERFVKLQKQT
jgi:hypothetical protein